jgi:hypothetical protein
MGKHSSVSLIIKPEEYKLTSYRYSAPDECKRRIVKPEDDLDGEMRVEDETLGRHGTDLDLKDQDVDKNVGEGKNGTDSDVAVSVVVPAAGVNTPMRTEQEVAPLEEVEGNAPDSDDKACPQIDPPATGSGTDNLQPPFPPPLASSDVLRSSTTLSSAQLTQHLPLAQGGPGFDVPDQPVGGSLTQDSSSVDPFPCDFTSNNWSGFSNNSTAPSLNVSPELWYENTGLIPPGLTLSHRALF